jgi:hypothetical protein
LVIILFDNKSPQNYNPYKIMNDHPSIATFQAHTKNKLASTLLAIFLSYWTWLYTYKRDKGFFWLSIVITIVFVAPVWALLSLVLLSTSYDITTWGIIAIIWIEIGIILGVGLWIWALIVAIARPQSWYDSYPFSDTDNHATLQNNQWKMTWAGILVIIIGAIILLNMIIQPVIYSGWETYFLARLITSVQFPLTIPAILSVCGGSYGLLKNSWGTILTGTIASLIIGIPSLLSPILGIISGTHRLSPFSIINVLGVIMGIVSLVLLIQLRKQNRKDLPQADSKNNPF